MSQCGEKCLVYSRVVGYYRPVTDWNKGKQQEYKDRKNFDPNNERCMASLPSNKEEVQEQNNA